MKRSVILLVAVAFIAVGLGADVASAQILPENHYHVYNTLEAYTVTIPLRLEDQFGIWDVQTLTLDKFANPVSKNGEPIYDENVHQTWWHIDVPETPRIVEIDNQFGVQNWKTLDARYLLLPALKNQTGLPPIWNHYKCYDAEGPMLNFASGVTLTDQWGTALPFILTPRYFCNPVAKYLQDGTVYPIIDPTIHLACYFLEPATPLGQPLVAQDQFGTWDLNAFDDCLLCVPSFKLTVIGVEESTWGKIKSLYR